MLTSIVVCYHFLVSIASYIKFIYFFCFREEYGKWITVVFDMRDTGMKNMDMEFIQYMIDLFKSYYPWILNNIIVFEMPWLLNGW